MSDLQFVAISDDGKMIILQTPNGEWIEVPFDASLVAPTRLPVEAPAPSAEMIELTPREIQARIRAGVSVHDLAEMSGSSDERIMAFAAPILMERQHVALRAGRTIIRRASGSGALSDVIEARLDPHGVVPADIEWDSFRREDGRWTVIVKYPSKEGEREAHWLFDVRNSALVPADDEARWLVGEVPAGRQTNPQAETVAMTVPHLVALPTQKEAHLPEIRESQVIKREVPLQAVPTQTAPPTPPPAAPPVAVTQVVSIDRAATLEAESQHSSSSFETANEDIQDSLFAEDAAADESPRSEVVLEEPAAPTPAETSADIPTAAEKAMQEYRRHTQIFERPTVPPRAPARTAAPIPPAIEWADDESENVPPLDTTMDLGDDTSTNLPPVREVTFEEPTPVSRDMTVEVKKSRAPSWDEILFGAGEPKDENF